MTTPIDIAYVEVVSNTKSFEKEIKDFVDGEVKDLEKEFDKTTKKIDKDLDDTAKSARKSFKEISDAGKKAANDIGETFQAAFNTVRLGVTRTSRRTRNPVVSFLDAADDRLNKFADKFPRIEKGFNVIVDGLIKGATEFGSAIGTVASSLGPLGFGIGAIILLLPGLLGIVINLSAALSTLSAFLLAIPAALSVVAAAIIPIVVGFNNFGEAIGAILEGDPEKIKEALDKLAPSAASVAKEFEKLLPRLSALQKVVQSSLFGPLEGDLTRLVTVAIKPLEDGMARVAHVIGQIISNFADLAGSKTGIETLNAVFDTTVSVLETLRDSGLGTTLFELIKATLPVVNTLFQKFIGFLTQLGDKLQTSIDDGSFQEWLDEAVQSLGDLLDFLGSIVAFFGALFTPETIDAGQELLKTFTDLFMIMAEWLATTDGKQFLEDMATVAQFLATAIAGAVFWFAVFIGVITEMVAVLLDFLGIADRTIVAAQNLGIVVVGAGEDILNVVSELPSKLMELGGKFADAGLFLIQSFINGFRQAGNFIGDVAGDIVGNVKGGLNKLIGTINNGISGLDALLPFSLSRIPSLAEGGVVPATPGGRIVRVAEAGEDEVIGSLDDVRDAFGGDNGGGFNFGPGSIVINFHGVVPTEAEARATGEAVATGMAGALTRRNIRSQVRARSGKL